MWQRLSSEARESLFSAQSEAHRFGDRYVSTEHLLLGLTLKECAASRLLQHLSIDVNLARIRIERQTPTLEAADPPQDMTLTPRAKRVIDLANDEAIQMGHGFIGTEHLLQALIREGDGVGGRVLASLGAELERARKLVGETPLADCQQKLPPLARTATSSIQKGIQVTAGILSVREARFGPDFMALIVLSKPTPAVEDALQKLDLTPPMLQAAIESEFLHSWNPLPDPELAWDDNFHPLDFLRSAALLKTSLTHQALTALGKDDEEIEKALAP